MKMPWQKYFVGVVILGAIASFFFFAPSTKAEGSCEGLIITELLPNPASPLSDSADEYIKLRNPFLSDIPAGGCKLKDQKGVIKEFTIPANVVVGGGEEFVFKSAVTKISLNNDEDGAVLLNNQGVELSKTPLYKNASDGRVFAFIDGQWIWKTIAATTTTLSPNVGQSDCEEIIISEVMPNPTGDDRSLEWVELFNSGEEARNLAGCTLTDIRGTVTKYRFNAVVMNPGAFLVFYSKDTKISLNNDTDGAKILNGETLVFETELYSNVLEGVSFAYDGASWGWTVKPTPGGQNIFELPITSTTKKTVTTKKATKKSPTTKSTKAKISANKAVKSSGTGEVKGEATSLENIWGTQSSKDNGPITDALLGYGVIILSFLYLFGYTIWIKRDWLSENLIKKFRRNS